MISKEVSKGTLYCGHGLTKSSSKEIKMTRKICFRLAGDTGVADMVNGK